jgi:uncharacterized protein (TIGR00730 family)
MLRSVCVFCGSAFGRHPEYRASAELLGRLLASQGLRLVYGGGNVGLMGAVADACLSAGGAVTGVIPQALVDREVAHRGLTELHIVRTMHERKAMMADQSDAFVVLPGGLGTFEEFFEVLTWSQLGLHQKPCGFLNVRGYYDRLLALMNHAVEEGFLRESHRHLLLWGDDPEKLLIALDEWRPAGVPAGLLDASET